MKKKYRIKKNSEIDAIFKLKKVKGNLFFALYQADHEYPHLRYALSIGKKYGKAHERNLAKRRLRDIILKLSPNIVNKSFIIVIKPTSKSLNYPDMYHHIVELLTKSKLMENKNA